jgi:hypothetical protein
MLIKNQRIINSNINSRLILITTFPNDEHNLLNRKSSQLNTSLATSKKNIKVNCFY